MEIVIIIIEYYSYKKCIKQKLNLEKEKGVMLELAWSWMNYMLKRYPLKKLEIYLGER